MRTLSRVSLTAAGFVALATGIALVGFTGVAAQTPTPQPAANQPSPAEQARLIAEREAQRPPGEPVPPAQIRAGLREPITSRQERITIPAAQRRTAIQAQLAA
jgi:hypothetical protein